MLAEYMPCCITSSKEGGNVPEMLFFGKECTADFVAFNADLNLTYNLNKNISFYTSFSHPGHRTDLIITQRSVSKWDIGATATFLNNRLNCRLEVNDILDKAHYNNLTINYGQTSYGTYGKTDFRGVNLSISYVIFSKPIKVRTERGNASVVDRTR